jgi:8-oxo-dGTP diphosphatase
MANAERHMVRAAVYLVFEKDDKVLLLRRHNTGYRDGEYTLPAGHVEANETFIQTCIREAKEEVCVDIKPEDLRLVHVMQRYEKGVDVIDYYFSAKKWTGEPKIGEPHKADDLRWASRDEIENQAIHFVGKALNNAADKILFSHDGIEVS